MIKRLKRPISFLSAFAMFMAMLLYFPGETFRNIDWGLTVFAEEYDENGFGSGEDPYQPATLTTDKYDIDGAAGYDEVYEIGNTGQLYWFAEQVNGGNVSLNAVLTADITDSSEKNWTPMGNSSNRFNGTFDGNGKTISGLYFEDTGTDYVGLFGYISGTVKNVGVINSNFTGNDYVGGVSGDNAGTITNCYNTGTITANASDAYVGGVSGDNAGTITNCYNTGTITANASDAYVGGVCGYNGIYNGTAEITNCYNTGKVSATGRDALVGGVCGYNNADSGTATITNCYNTGKVSATGINACVGGVCGENYNPGGTATITNCYNTGKVSATGINAYVGGVCGQNYNRTIANCYYDSDKYSGNAIGEDLGTATDAEGKTTAQFNIGEVAFLLSQGCTVSETTYVGSVWGQTLGTEDYPVLDGTKVYQVNVYAGCEGNPGEPSTGYSNTDASVYADHNDTNGDGMCDYCDKLIHSIVREVSATLDGDIGLNYYIALPESVTTDTGAYVQFTVNGQNTKVFVKDVTDIEGSVYKFTCWLTAKEMRDNVTFKLYDGNGTLIDIYSNSGDKVEGASFDYTLETYLKTLSSDENAALKYLADVTLVYGAYAQNAFNHNADPNLNGSELADVTADILEINKMTKSAEIPEGLKLTEMTLILETETTLRLYFKSDNIENYTFKLDGTGVTLNKIEEEGLYYVEIANISAKNLDTKHTLIINDNCELTFNALSYAYATVKAGANDNICNVVKALYKYNDAANDYFGN